MQTVAAFTACTGVVLINNKPPNEKRTQTNTVVSVAPKCVKDRRCEELQVKVIALIIIVKIYWDIGKGECV